MKRANRKPGLTRTACMLAILATRSATSEAQTQQQYPGASGAVYYGSYSSFSPAEQADIVDAINRDRERRVAMLVGRRDEVRPPSPEAAPPVSPVVPAATIPPAAPPPAKSIQEHAGAASGRIADEAEELGRSIPRLAGAIRDLVQRHEQAPEFEVPAEADRLKLFRQLLEEVVKLGRTALAAEDELVAAFMGWAKASVEAAPVFRKAEKHFHDRAASAPPDGHARKLYAKAEAWYGARAARCEIRGKMSVPTNFQDQMAEVKDMVEAAEDLLSFVKKDEDMFKDQAGQGEELTTFLRSFTTVEEVLASWTETLVKDLRPEGDEPE
ncbi:hypothetical protein [Paludisphaera mucosa]|uniref:Uncharacterized protein n=1 Tax=Paludisphaera mucosa TaxID=3030827 RepID=A0ABT6FLM5_9BACT|nr:hypothetical protein [Paludisphaera mucosa]MDG3008464.1 hypothetical protein [Paludisphaera mucosa]